jgi:hypothetical protein
MPQSSARAFLLLALLPGLAGCGNGDVLRSFGLSRDAPDEFVVTARAPLSMPPTYMLRPPQPGASRPQELQPPNAAEAALVPQSALAAAPAGSSPGQLALVQEAGPPAPADIRARVDAQAAIDAPKPGLTDKILFWFSPAEPGITVNAPQEAQRLRNNAALGRGVDQGETAIIRPQRKSSIGRFLDNLF